MSTDRLQLTLLPEPLPQAQPLPAEMRDESIELMARMLIAIVRPVALAEASEAAREGRDEHR